MSISVFVLFKGIFNMVYNKLRDKTGDLHIRHYITVEEKLTLLKTSMMTLSTELKYYMTTTGHKQHLKQIHVLEVVK